MIRQRVVMLVRNAVTTDGRVLRAAGALQESGYEVIVIGQVDRDHTQPDEVLPSGVRVVRLTLHSPLTWLADLASRWQARIAAGRDRARERAEAHAARLPRGTDGSRLC